VTELLLVRHGETDWNVEQRVQGHTDRPLNETGLAQAQALATELADEHLDAVYASDLSRARDTARAIADPRGLEVAVLPALRERHFGTWEGLRHDEIHERFPHRAESDPWGDGETPEELAARVLSALGDIAEWHPEGRVLVVTHGGALRAVLSHCTVEIDEIANCHLARIGVQDGTLRSLD
jgi:broad specificity phosphatase PhoE